jgi:hypothetical protein
MTRPVRIALLGAAAAAMIAGLWGGLTRIGVPLPSAGPASPADHGVMMVVGFFGALISLERAVALDRSWAYLAPPLAVLGAAAQLPVASLAAAVILLYGSVLVWQRQPALFTAVMAAGAGAWAAAAIADLADAPLHEQAPWLVAFLVLVIVGERLELSRMAPPSSVKQPAFAVAAGVLGAGLFVGVVAPAAGGRLFGLGLLACALWLAVFDVARRAVRIAGVTRFIAVCLLAGYAWMAVGGVLWLGGGQLVAGFTYDAALHAVFVGFVLSMVFGHVNLVAPAVLGITVPYRRWFAVHLGLLHVSMAVRLTGDLAESVTVRRWGGVGNAAAVVVFLLATVAAVVSGRRTAVPSRGRVRETALAGRGK